MAPRTLPGVGLQAFAPLNEAGWNAWVDTNFRLISALMQGRVISVVSTLPGSPVNGNMHIVTTGTNAHSIAVRDNGAWVYIVPQAGWRMYNQTDGLTYQFRGDLWVKHTWLGNIVISPDNTAYPNNNGEVTFASYANDTMTILKKGSDGVVRKCDLAFVPA